jgi:hypothetical protein
MKNRMLAVGQAVSPANRPEGRRPSSMLCGFSPLSRPDPEPPSISSIELEDA